MRTRTILATAAAVVALGAAGCGASSGGGSNASKPADPNAPEVSPAGDIPDDQAFVAYSPRGSGFSLRVPEGWSRSASGAAVTFTDKLNAIRMETVSARAPLTRGEAARSEVPKLSRTVRGFAPLTVSTVKRAAGSAVRVTYMADAKPNPVTGKAGRDAVERYFFFHKGKNVVLTLSGPKGANNVEPWKIVTESLRWSR
ncbi:MAG: hypothetical protein ACR2NH_00305 [Solirubrobacteraceae bacterium]